MISCNAVLSEQHRRMLSKETNLNNSSIISWFKEKLPINSTYNQHITIKTQLFDGKYLHSELTIDQNRKNNEGTYGCLYDGVYEKLKTKFEIGKLFFLFSIKK